jgi:transcriptional regulator with XRE-family HTH domain
MILNTGYLKELMKTKNWSNAELASRSGISAATVSRILAGKRGAGSFTLAAIRKTFPEEPVEKLFYL